MAFQTFYIAWGAFGLTESTMIKTYCFNVLLRKGLGDMRAMPNVGVEPMEHKH